MSTSVTLVGNISRDVEIKFTPSGKTVATFGLAVGSRRRLEERWVDGPTSFYRVTCWDSLAEHVGDSLEKGQRVIVSGRMQVREWKDDQGTTRTSVEITADDVGPSLRWATAEVTKAERKTPAAEPAPPAFDPSEEPF